MTDRAARRRRERELDAAIRREFDGVARTAMRAVVWRRARLGLATTIDDVERIARGARRVAAGDVKVDVCEDHGAGEVDAFMESLIDAYRHRN